MFTARLEVVKSRLVHITMYDEVDIATTRIPNRDLGWVLARFEQVQELQYDLEELCEYYDDVDDEAERLMERIGELEDLYLHNSDFAKSGLELAKMAVYGGEV